MPAVILAAFAFVQFLLLAPADPGFPLINVIYDRSDFSFPSESRRPHESMPTPAAEMFTMGAVHRSDAAC